MNNHNTFFAAISGLLLIVAGCTKKAEPLPYYSTGVASQLSASASTVAVTAANAAQNVITFNWTHPGFATDSAHYKYVIEIAPKGTQFAHPVAYTVTAVKSLGILGADINNMLISWGANYGIATELEVRLKASYANNNDMKMSNVLGIKASAYAVPFTLSASATGSFGPTPQNKDNVFTTLSWTAPVYGTSTLAYTLEYALAGTNFAAVKTMDIAVDSLQKSLTGMELYQMANNVGVPLNTTGSVTVRIKGIVSGTGQVSYSSTQTLAIHPVEMIVYLYLPGDYQGWSPATSARLASSDGTHYEGYVWVPAAGSGEFKITSAPDWDHTNYGGTVTATGGVLDVAGGNLKWPANGKFYLVKVNMNTKEWTVTETSWGLIGSATPGGWDTSTPLAYDAVSGKWKATISFTSGEFKFRANNSWDLNLGIDAANSSYLWYGGSNISATAGIKTIWLDVSNPMKYTYTVQ